LNVSEPWQAETPDAAGRLEVSVRAFNTFLLAPNPAFRGAPGLYEDAVVSFMKRDGHVVRVQGEIAKRLLLDVFNPDVGTYRFEAPKVETEGRYGIVTRRFSIEEAGRKPVCYVQHVEAFRTIPDWEFFAVTIAAMPTLYTCKITPG
jgi:hypothetical protein